tara:strand:+ start:20217 stop:20717 length:501 start_codon:yes stop_codon:yes gene_type:complete
MNNKWLLALAGVLVYIGIAKPDLSSISFPSNTSCTTDTCVVDAPSDDILLEKARAITSIVKESNDSTRKSDCLKLSSLYADMAVLIELDEKDQVIADTSNIKEANSLAGKMLRLNIKDKYPGLAEAARDLLSSSIGDDDVVLDVELRSKAVSAFRALSWAFYEGGK